MQPEICPHEMCAAEFWWMLVDNHVSNFHDHQARTFVPSDFTCVSMSKWYGEGGHWINIGLPNYIVMGKKPANGSEIQNSEDGWAWMMLRLKLEKYVKDEDAHLVSLDSDGACLSHGIQVALFLLQPCAGAYPPRVVCTDSYFSSVFTIHALNANGLMHIGVIEIATIKSPAAYLDFCDLNERGDTRHLVRLDDYGWTVLLAMVWLDMDYSKFVSNAEGVEDHAQPMVHKRWHQLEKNAYTDPECVTLTAP